MKPIQYIVTSEEMQRYDNNTIEYFKVPGIVLMEQAALATVDEIVQRFPDCTKKILVLAGKGNNGGDACATARLLYQKGFSVTVCIVSNKERKTADDSRAGYSRADDSHADYSHADYSRNDFSPSARIQYEILTKMAVPIVTELPVNSYDILVDGIFGVGLSRKLEGKAKEILEEVNTWDIYKIALDMPSGIDGTNGKVMGTAFRADCTITYGFIKRGLCMLPGAAYAGEVIKKEIGITRESFLNEPPKMFCLDGEIKDYLPKRSRWGHKGTFGKVLVVAGSENVGGAALLSAKAAMMTGCGMVRVCTHENQRNMIGTALPESLLDTYRNAKEAVELVQKGIHWADVIILGPGLGTGDIAVDLWKTVIQGEKKPLVLDADGINLLANTTCKEIFCSCQKKETKPRQIVMTPHLLELARVAGCDVEKIKEQGTEILQTIAEEFLTVMVQKDARTVIGDPQGRLCMNLSGDSGMATAGSGDVLTGIIGALLAQGIESFEAACTGVYIHAKAGETAALKKNSYSMMAGDICEALAEVLK